jgi:hypothetical protein
MRVLRLGSGACVLGWSRYYAHSIRRATAILTASTGLMPASAAQVEGARAGRFARPGPVALHFAMRGLYLQLRTSNESDEYCF